VDNVNAKYTSEQNNQTYCAHFLLQVLKQTGSNDPIASDPMP
jgi:hypothetical protein